MQTKTIHKIEPITQKQVTRKRVAVYARVSKSNDRLLNSVSAQISNYTKVIKNNPNWEFVGVYSDVGISGVGTKARDGFNTLISDCQQGKIDIVLTKSISRFARNTVDLLENVRQLKDLGIEVRFERENINSLTADGEMMLSILASFAQEESVSTSHNIKWGIRKRYEQGTIGIKNKKVFGYRLIDEKYVIELSEAKAVQKMFKMRVDGSSYSDIVRYLNSNNYKTIRGCEFSVRQVKYILTNEIYVGDLMLQKCYIENPLTKKRVINNGQLPKYYIENCHEPIITRKVFEEVQDGIIKKSKV